MPASLVPPPPPPQTGLLGSANEKSACRSPTAPTVMEQPVKRPRQSIRPQILLRVSWGAAAGGGGGRQTGGRRAGGQRYAAHTAHSAASCCTRRLKMWLSKGLIQALTTCPCPHRNTVRKCRAAATFSVRDCTCPALSAGQARQYMRQAVHEAESEALGPPLRGPLEWDEAAKTKSSRSAQPASLTEKRPGHTLGQVVERCITAVSSASWHFCRSA